METTYQLLPSCNCGHQNLLSPGSTCDTCMGIVQEPKEQNDDWYGADYFDALEQEIGNGGMSA